MVLDTATIVKLTRTMAIIPITLMLSVRTARRSRVPAGGAAARLDSGQPGRGAFSLKRAFPMFILWFVLAAAATTLFQSASAGLFPAEVSTAGQHFFAGCKQASKFCIVTAMAAIGLNTNFIKLVRSGGKPILQGLICWLAIAAVSLGMQWLLGLM